MEYILENSSGCSSGCESGWTMYLDNSSISPHEYQKRNEVIEFDERKRIKEADEDEEEDLSMVSDASSGPPHFAEEDDGEEAYGNLNSSHALLDAALRKKSGKVKKSKENHCHKALKQTSLLDDTASSPVLSLSTNNFRVSNNCTSAENLLEISQGYSTTHFEGRPGYYDYQGHYDFWHSSLSGNFLQQNQLFQERRWL